MYTLSREITYPGEIFFSLMFLEASLVGKDWLLLGASSAPPFFRVAFFISKDSDTIGGTFLRELFTLGKKGRLVFPYNCWVCPFPFRIPLWKYLFTLESYTHFSSHHKAFKVLNPVVQI